MRALPLVAAILTCSIAALADQPLVPPPAPVVPILRNPRVGTPRRFNPTLGNATAPAASASASTPPTLPGTPRPAESLAPAAAHPVLAPSAPPAARRRFRLPVRKAEAPSLPAPALKLTVDAPSPEAPWLIRATNTGTIPLRIIADARIVAFDISPAGAAETMHAITCELPHEMRPADDDDRSLVLPPGRSFAEAIDPRLFCFGAREAAALVAGATVVPRFVGSHEVAVVTPLGEAEPAVATEHEWAGTPSSIGAAVVSATKDGPRPRTLVVSTSAFVDVDRAPDATVTITVKNESNAPIPFLFRPETIALDVTGPSGIGVTDPSPTVHCVWRGPPPSPILELFTRLAPNGGDALTVLPSDLCPEKTLAQPGLYLVRAKLDTRRASGTPVGLHTFDGEVVSDGTTRLRVRKLTGKAPALARPQLELMPKN